MATKKKTTEEKPTKTAAKTKTAGKKASGKSATAKKERVKVELPKLSLSSLSPVPGSKKRRKRIGFGEGSGSGKTSGKGTKGHKARSGYHQTRGLEGGQTPLYRRLPKVGFTSRKRVLGENVYQPLDLGKLLELDLTGEITHAKLREMGVVRRSGKVKLLGNVECKKKIIVEVHAASAAARSSVEKAGGEIRIIKA